jgi:hypothetical protein
MELEPHSLTTWTHPLSLNFSVLCTYLNKRLTNPEGIGLREAEIHMSIAWSLEACTITYVHLWNNFIGYESTFNFWRRNTVRVELYSVRTDMEYEIEEIANDPPRMPRIFSKP